jgi:NADPH:quinone reductase-like Zn-dependent oxidoreductase
MRAIRVHEHGDGNALQLEDLPVPEPKPGEVRIKVAWSALNHLDTWVRRGVPGHKFPLPLIPGCDFSGIIDACGKQVEAWEVGDRVCVNPGFFCGKCPHCKSGNQHLCGGFGIYGETTHGGNADYAVVRAENLLLVPDGFPLSIAAAFPLTYLTAWRMLVERCQIREGEKVVVHAAGSGVSVAATQIAKHFGAEVMITAGTDEKVQKGLQNGADHGCNYQKKEWAGGSKVDIIVDHVGVDTIPAGIWLLAKGGRLVTCGVTSGAEMKLHFAPIFFKSLSILGSTMGSPADLKQVAELVWSGLLSPIVDSQYSLDEIRKAHDCLGSRDVFGKILLEVDSNLA